MQGLEKLDNALKIAEKDDKSIGVVLDDVVNTCFCVPYEEYVASMKLSTYELLYVVHPNGQID